MLKSWAITWLSVITCAVASQVPLSIDNFITPCLFGIDLSINSCKAPGKTTSYPPSQFPKQQYEDDEECLSDDCDPFSNTPESLKTGSWSHNPKCIQNTASESSFCVYTSSSFNHNRGISLLTTPSIANAVMQLPAFTNASVHAHINNSSPRPFVVRHIEGRGNGLFATKELKRGELILADLPVGIYHSEGVQLDYEADYRHLHVAYEQLPQKTRALFMEMAQHFGGDEVMERINTNAFHGLFEGAPHFLLYPETAKMNHACRPNTMSYHDSATLIHTTHASRTIQIGEELTIPYTDILQSRSKRQEALSTYWGFTCTCALCALPNSAATLSDGRIHSIQTLQTKLRDWSPDSPATPAMAEDLIRLLSQEQVYAAVATGYVLAALAYNAVGNGEMAARYAKVAVEAGLVTGAVDGEVEDVKRLITGGPKGDEGFRRHWTWMKRAHG